MVHRSVIGHLVKGYPVGYEFSVSKPSSGNKIWHLENNKPEMGLTFQVIDFRNREQLGFAYIVAPFAEIPLKSEQKMSRLILRLCFGITYIDKPFDIKTNRKNRAIGSHFNAFVQFKWFWHVYLNKNLRFEPGFVFSHASNGKAKNPNLGLNVLSINTGLHFSMPKAAPQVPKIDSSSAVRSRNELVFISSWGINRRNIGSERLNVYMISTAYQRNVRNTHKFSAGLDFFYDDNYQLDYEYKTGKLLSGFDQWRVSARLGYSYNLGRISFPIEIGYYVFQRINPDASLISRIGVRYFGKNGLVAHIGLRTHYAVAYNFEYGLGYRLYLKRRN